MAAAVVDISINEKETFELSIEFWENSDLTDPVDISTWTFNGAFSFSNICIPMTFTKIDNSVTARVEASALVDLPAVGSYSIEATDALNTFRIQQGSVEVDRGVVCS